MIPKIKVLIILLVFLIPSLAYPNGGGPILLFVSGSAFIFGQLWILFIETYFLNKLSNLGMHTAFSHVFLANLISTIFIGFGFPFLLAVITAFGMELPQPYGGYASAIGTWVYDRAPHGEYLSYITFAWLFVTLMLTVFCEKAFYKRYWKRVNFVPEFSLGKFIWKIHAASYSGLLVLVIVFWRDLFGGM